jgi:hypothetical protein
MTGGGIIHEKEEEHTSSINPNSQYSRNKIYNVKSPKSKNTQKSKNMPTNT